jgi:hypothetical protein
VFVAGGTSPTYTLTYDYEGHPGISDPSTLDLAKRANNATTSWTEANATLNQGAHTLTLTGQSGTEYILGSESGDNSLPVELSAFSATTSGDNVIIKWRTESEVNNVGFSVYRSEIEDGKYIKITFVNGDGNTGMPTDYQFIDKNAEANKTYYYYLEDIDIAGVKNRSNTIKVVVPPAKPVPKAFALLQNYPNPFNPETWLPYELPGDAAVVIRIYDLKGQLVRQLDLGNQKAGYYVDKKAAAYWNGKDQLGQPVASGIYFYSLRADDFEPVKRMVILK